MDRNGRLYGEVKQFKVFKNKCTQVRIKNLCSLEKEKTQDKKIL